MPSVVPFCDVPVAVWPTSTCAACDTPPIVPDSMISTLSPLLPEAEDRDMAALWVFVSRLLLLLLLLLPLLLPLLIQLLPLLPPLLLPSLLLSPLSRFLPSPARLAAPSVSAESDVGSTDGAALESA